jgi:hypothetical protein
LSALLRREQSYGGPKVSCKKTGSVHEVFEALCAALGEKIQEFMHDQ